MEYNEYMVTVKTSEGEKARIVVHTGSDADARRMAEQATRLTVVDVKRQS